MIELVGSLSWPLVCALVAWIGHKHGERFWESKRVKEQDRLDKLEREIRQLVQAQNLKGLR